MTSAPSPMVRVFRYLPWSYSDKADKKLHKAMMKYFFYLYIYLFTNRFSDQWSYVARDTFPSNFLKRYPLSDLVATMSSSPFLRAQTLRCQAVGWLDIRANEQLNILAYRRGLAGCTRSSSIRVKTSPESAHWELRVRTLFCRHG